MPEAGEKIDLGNQFCPERVRFLCERLSLNKSKGRKKEGERRAGKRTERKGRRKKAREKGRSEVSPVRKSRALIINAGAF